MAGFGGEPLCSPAGSPAGSPTGAQFDGQELAMRMVQAAEQASIAARLAAEAINKNLEPMTVLGFEFCSSPTAMSPNPERMNFLYGETSVGG